MNTGMDLLLTEMADDFKEMMEKSPAIERYISDFKEHCQGVVDFIDKAPKVLSDTVVLRALRLSFGAVADGESFFDEFDEAGLRISIIMAIEDEIDLITYKLDSGKHPEKTDQMKEKLLKLKTYKDTLKDVR
jgi:hypothetical protein